MLLNTKMRNHPLSDFLKKSSIGKPFPPTPFSTPFIVWDCPVKHLGYVLPKRTQKQS